MHHSITHYSTVWELLSQTGQKVPEARRARNRSFDCRSGQAPRCSFERFELLELFELFLSSEAIERNEAYGAFSPVLCTVEIRDDSSD
jgi:hypothetical protein